MNKKIYKLSKKEKMKIKGGVSFVTIWGMSLLTITVIRSLFSDKSNLAINGFGKASWESKNQKTSLTNDEKMLIGLKNYFE